MKQRLLSSILAVAALGISLSVQAHDPKEHMKDAEKPNCDAMKGMDHSKMDQTDPVMQAMMKQCAKDMNHNDGDHSTNHEDHHRANSEAQHTEHQH